MSTPRLAKDVINNASLRFIKGWRLHFSARTERAEWEDPAQQKYWISYTDARQIVQELHEHIDVEQTETGRIYFLAE